jgi:hypothetical protein
MDTLMFATIVDRVKHGIPPGHGWQSYTITCECGLVYLPTKRPYTCTTEHCPRCGAETEMVWLPNDGYTPCDGPWLAPVGWETASIFANN